MLSTLGLTTPGSSFFSMKKTSTGLTGLRSSPPPISRKKLEYSKIKAKLPERVNWFEKGMVTQVEHQGNFGTCYGFAAVGAVESLAAIHGAPLTPLSVQQLLDCPPWCGCARQGGYVHRAFEHIMENGIATAEDYPYDPEAESICRPFIPRVRIKNYGRVFGEGRLLKSRVARQPVAVILAVNEFFDEIGEDGIAYPYFSRSPTTLHSMLCVGYGVDKYGRAYWTLKNSYGTNWGNSGFCNIPRGENAFGMGTEPSYFPIM